MDRLSIEHFQRFTLTYALTQPPPDWAGSRGRGDAALNPNPNPNPGPDPNPNLNPNPNPNPNPNQVRLDRMRVQRMMLAMVALQPPAD